jgi:arylsulfatase A-like enzyme
LSIDTLRADHLGAYGGPIGLTPNLDALARDGVVFRDAITSSPWTLPSMVSLFTALDPGRHGAGLVTNRRDPLGRSPLPPGTWSLAGGLRAAGYSTHAIVTNPYLALHYGLGADFDGYANLTIESEALLAMRQTTFLSSLAWLWPAVMVGDRGERVSSRAERWLAEVTDEGPFFLWLHYIDPHPPYSRAGVTRHKSFRGDTLMAPRASYDASFSLTSPDVARLRSGEIRLSRGEKEAVRVLYRAEVASVDDAIGRVLGAIDRLGLRDRTLVVCVADHGEEFWEHGGVEHGHTVYEELIRIPLIMRLPGRLPAGLRLDGIVRMVDVAPTILDLLGLTTPLGVEGATAVPLIEGTATPERAAIVQNLLFAEERVAVRSREWKYVRWEDGREELYDLRSDSAERRNLASVENVVAPLRAMYSELQPREIGIVAADQREREVGLDARPGLRALGYLR